MVELEQIKTSSFFPTEDDYISAAESLIRLHEINQLDLNDIVSGKLLGIQTSASK